MSKQKQNIEQLKILKSKLHAHKMSVLIGAGFSKNVDKDFLSWKELLEDIVRFLYGNEIKDKYLLLKQKINEEDFVKNEIQKIIDKEGFLEIVSLYIKRKGIREVIDIYIENHTPQLLKEGEKLFIKRFDGKQQNKKSISANALSLHEKLLELPWNNIYTTNYDNLLEINIENEIQETISDKKKEIENALKELYQQQEKKNQEKNQLETEISSIEAQLSLLEDKKKNKIDSTLSVTILPNEECELQKEKSTKETEKQKISSDFALLTRNIRSQEAEKLNLEKELSECITTITHSSDLQIKRNKNIIKLHGSLRKDNDVFGFDGDNHLHYIIAKEDYETYPKKHEAFTQLMRISLLQEFYCLIGFSGVDPNFISWISWVRDILERKQTENQEDYKIFLIEVIEEKNTETEKNEKSLFFENHRIVKIPLWEKEVIDFLKNETNFKDKTGSPNDLLKLFFHYLSNEECIYTPQAFIELSEQKRYNDAWKNITERAGIQKIQLSNKNQYQNILQLKDKVRIPSIEWSNFHDKQEFLYFISDLLQESDTDKKEIILNILPAAIRDSFLTPHFIWEDGLKDILPHITQESHNTELSLFSLRESILFVDENAFTLEYETIEKNTSKKDDLIYNSILYAAFRLDFTSVKKQLEDWKPKQKSLWTIKKIGLLSLFDRKEAEELLSDFCNHFDNFDCQEQLYTLEILNYIQRHDYISHSKNDIYDKIEQYKDLGFKSFRDNFDHIAKEITKAQNKNEIKPLGEGRFTVSNSVNFSNGPTLPQNGMQFIQLLIEFGIPLSLSSIHIKEDTWYSIVSHIYKYMPYPTVYYSLQINNDKVLRRIAQEYSYCEELKDDIPNILEKLLLAYLNDDTPKCIKRNILIFASELFIAVHPTRWQVHFYEIWQSLEKEKSLFSQNITRIRTDIFSFVTKGLVYINDVSIIRKLLISIIDNFEEDPNTAVEYLYYFANNDTKHKLGRKVSNKQIDEKIDVLIQKISQKNESVIFVLGNLHQLLSQTHKDKIETAIENFDFIAIQSERIWRALLFFVQKESIQVAIKNGIINNRKLWDTGIHESSYSDSKFIQLHIINKKCAKNNGIEWNNDECKAIFDKLKTNFEDIKKVREKNKRDDGFINFKHILEEMNYFLLIEKSKLKNLSDYERVCQEVKQLYYQERKYDTISSALLSNEKSVIIWALSELFYDIYYLSGVSQHIEEVDLLVNKVLMKKTPALEACISYLSNLLKNRIKDKTLRSFSISLSLILDEYNKDESDIEKPFLHQNMIQIANVLKKWGVTHNAVDKWLNIKDNSNFNNININDRYN